MASFKKDGNVWRVQIARRGVRLSGSFPTKKAAEAWAVEKENEIMKGAYSGAGSRTVADLFDEYAKRVSDGKAGGQWERTRFKAFKNNFPDLAAKLLTETNSHDLGPLARRAADGYGQTAPGERWQRDQRGQSVLGRIPRRSQRMEVAAGQPANGHEAAEGPAAKMPYAVA
jgi:hypothetical protein